MNNCSDNTFALHVEGINLEEINPIDSARLLEALCMMLGAKHLKWDSIHTGSAFYKVKTDEAHINEKLLCLTEAIENQPASYQVVLGFLKKYPKAETEILFKSAANDEFKIIHKFDRKEEGVIFTQQETIRGRVITLKEGNDKTDHIHISTPDGKIISVAASPEVAKKFREKWRTDQIIDISGKAKYKYRTYDDIELIEFIAESFIDIEQASLTDWIEKFRQAGESGWSQFEDPIAEWLKERHE